MEIIDHTFAHEYLSSMHNLVDSDIPNDSSDRCHKSSEGPAPIVLVNNDELCNNVVAAIVDCESVVEKRVENCVVDRPDVPVAIGKRAKRQHTMGLKCMYQSCCEQEEEESDSEPPETPDFESTRLSPEFDELVQLQKETLKNAPEDLDNRHLIKKCCGVGFAADIEVVQDGTMLKAKAYMKTKACEEEEWKTKTKKSKTKIRKTPVKICWPEPSDVVDPKSATKLKTECMEPLPTTCGSYRIQATKATQLTVCEAKESAIDPSEVELKDGAVDDGVAAKGGLHVMTRVDPRATQPAYLSISNVGELGWSEIEVTIDSGACDTVMPTRLCSHISIVTTEESRGGLEYEVANGETIPNVGERHCLLMSEDSATEKRITFQCADIHKPLLSVSRCADLGFHCVLGRHGGQLIDEVSGEIIPLHRRGNLYVMRAWIRQDKSADFRRPQ
jgi:hypothetical protein